MSDVIYLHLINREVVVGKILDYSDTDVTVGDPMLLETVNVQGMLGTNLTKYLPYADVQQSTFLMSHIVSLTTANDEFTKYYYNVLDYQRALAEKQKESNLTQINRNMESLLSDENKRFNEAIFKYRNRIPPISSSLQ
jgi:hypothetical protein